ncbi:MAG: diguanylate cyclase [Burkholderiales bacterium]|nr:diguanylate cyclase [Burkholderiales bacterium]
MSGTLTPALDFAACMGTGWQIAPDLSLRLALIAGLLGLSVWARRLRYFPGQAEFVALHAVMTAWVSITTAEHAAMAAACKGTLALVAWPFIFAQPVLWTLFLRRYVRSDTQAPTLRGALLIGLPWALLTALALSNGAHGLFYGPGTMLGPPILGLPRMHYDYAALYPLIFVWGYGWLLSAMVLVFGAWRQAEGSARLQWALFMLVMAAPLLANAAYLGLGWRLMGGDPTPLSYGVALAVFAWLIRHDQLFRVLPMARGLLFTELPDPVLVLDGHGRVMDANAAARRLAGANPPRTTALGDWPCFGAPLAALLAERPEGELHLAQPELVFEVRARDIGPEAHPIGRLVQLRDVTERHQVQVRLVQTLVERNKQLDQVASLQAELREQALRDPLTGLQNRRALAQRFEGETARPLALALLDVDHFKRINDNAGHAAGDAVLCALAQRLLAGLRRGDEVYRFGGEEFALLLPGADAAGAQRRLDRLREEVAATPLTEAWGAITFSAGVAEAGRHGDTLDALVGAADAAMYRAKEDGRNRVRVAT